MKNAACLPRPLPTPDLNDPHPDPLPSDGRGNGVARRGAAPLQWVCLLAVALALAAAWPAAAQVTTIPTVVISATDPHASESGDTGTFTVAYRLPLDTPPPNFSLVVFYQVSGTASNGVDYEKLSGSVTIPAFGFGATITVTPIDDSEIEGDETVVLQLTGSPLACASCGYNIGTPSNAVVTIADNDTGTNHPPFVQLNAPQNGAVFTAPADIALRAYAQDPEDGTNLKVEFFEGTNSLGFGTFVPALCPSPFCPYYALVWSNVPPGEYVLTAQATDSAGASSRSQPAKIFVTPPGAQPEVNIFATDDTGSEIPVVPPWLDIAQRVDPAVFTVTRTGPTDSPLTVFYSIGGTASNGVDYILHPSTATEVGTRGSIVIPSGASSADIEVDVIDDLLVEGTETVELTLHAPPCIAIFPPPPGCYVVGSNSQAVAKILDNDLTPAPVVTIVATDPHAAEAGPDTGTFTVSRTGDTSNALAVFFRVGGTAQMGIDYLKLSNSVMFPFFIDLPPNVVIPAGASSADITVTPIDDNLVEGNETVVLELIAPTWAGYLPGVPSNAVVTIADNEPATNHPPVVQLDLPRDGEVFVAPTNILLRARAQDVEDGFNLTVEFFEGANSLGLGTFVASRCVLCPYYALVWSNVPPGGYVITAKATDSGGATAVSNPARIKVLENPPTNLPPVVDIIARDPFASEGTNFWLGLDTTAAVLAIWNWWHVNIGGTNTATFVVHRHGPTNDDLVVNYDIGGTASNGVDYVALPGTVTIPAGRHSARIVVVPIDDTLVEGIETVVLKLEPSADYTIGFPARAAAFIIDNDLHRLPCAVLSDGEFHLCQPATNGFCFRIEASTDLLHWGPICTNVVTDGALHFVDPDSPLLDTRFYRAQPEPSLPPDD